LRRSGEGVKGRCLPWSKEEEGAYIFLMKQVPVDKNHAPFKLNGQSRTVFGLLKAPELQRLSVTVKVLRVGVMIVGVISVGVMTLSQNNDRSRL
jgi:hypothetical protein